MSLEALTADVAFERYERFFNSDALVQNNWHGRGSDGRELACGLGALDPEINNPRDCPSSVMPRWLAQMVPWFFDGQDFADAKTWGLAFYADLKRLGGAVPFSVIHDWQANVVGPLAIEVATKRKLPTDVHEKLQALHLNVFAGGAAPRTEWYEALRPALFQVYRGNYAYADAYADADANADAYANAYAYADANAYADADANADANANAYAYARKASIKRLADGMVECLGRVPAVQS